jgi:preprotein translocase subunit SecE
VARANRRGRNVDDDGIDDPIEDAYEDEELDVDDPDDVDLDETDLDEADLDEPDRRATRRGVGTATRTRVATARTRSGAAPGFFGWLAKRAREIVAELQKVIWPTRKELLTYTTVVVVFVALVMSYVAGLDVGFARLMFLIFGRSSQ